MSFLVVTFIFNERRSSATKARRDSEEKLKLVVIRVVRDARHHRKSFLLEKKTYIQNEFRLLGRPGVVVVSSE